MNWLEQESPVLRVSLDTLATITEDTFAPEMPKRIDVLTEAFVIPLLVVRRASATRLLILNNGAMDLDRSERRPIFQRSSWWKEINAHQVYVCDPGTVGNGALALNWMQGAPPLWTNMTVTKALRRISTILGVRDPSQRTYFGSSAGGFAALLQLCADKKANCVINNAQFDWTRWYAHHVTPVLQKHFSGRTAAAVRESWPHRTNALAYLLRNPEPVNIAYYVNMGSIYDKDIQLPIFQNFLSNNAELCGNISVHHYSDEKQGHNPLPKPHTLRLLNQRHL